MARIPLPLLPCELRRLGVSVSYRRAYNAVLDGLIPAERGEDGRWTVARDDLPTIAGIIASVARDPAGTAPALAAAA